MQPIYNGAVAERLIAAVLKTALLETATDVQIVLAPPICKRRKVWLIRLAGRRNIKRPVCTAARLVNASDGSGGRNS